MAIARVNIAQPSGSGSGTTIATQATSATAGNFLVGWVEWEDQAATITVADTAGSTWDTSTIAQSPAHGVRGQMFFAMNTPGHASNVVTVTFSVSVPFSRLAVIQYSGVATSSAYDGSNSGGTAGSTQFESGNVTTTNADDLLAFGGGMYGSHATTPGSNWTEVVDAAHTLCFYERIVAATGTYAVTGTGADSVTYTGSEGNSGTLGAFKAAAGGGGATPIYGRPRTLMGVGR